MGVEPYTECFWGEDLYSKNGCEALKRRNQDGKKMCQEFEDYLKKRAKLENEFSKSLGELSKCFKQKEKLGDLEAALNTYKIEIESMSSSHHGAYVFFTKQAEEVKFFREKQLSQIKQVEENLIKAQNSKLNQLKKTTQLEITYRKKCLERDAAEGNFKDLERDIDRENNKLQKDLEKAKVKSSKAEDDAQKADDAYKANVIYLDTTTSEWEKAMENTCQIIQELDEKRIRYIRQELWTCLNVDSKLALDIDNCCESVRQRLEKCDISQDIQSFIDVSSTGNIRPKHFVYRNYASIKDQDSDGEGSVSSTDTNDDDKRNSGNRKMGFNKFRNAFKT